MRLLQPLALGAIAVLLLNDHVFKAVAPGLVTGKLSDVAGLVFFPLLLVAVAELALARAGRWRGPDVRLVTVAVAATGIGFAAVKLLPGAETLYEQVLGIAQWPVRLLAGLIPGGGAAGGPVPVDLTRDPTDLVALAALWIPMEIGARRAGRREAADERAATVARLRPYDLVVAGLSVAMLAGATLDGWAHSHQLLALESVITPWHVVVYLAFAAVAIVLLGPPVTARLAGRRAIAAIPVGYGTSVLGVAFFLAMGALDTAWHLLFGIEADAEALLSPTHLGLGVGACLIASGPIRAAWARDDKATWPAFLPAILSAVAITGLVAFALHIANPFVDPWPRFSYQLDDPTWYGPHLGVASAVVTAGIVVVPMLLLVARWRTPPPGWLTLLFGASLAGLTFLHDGGQLVGAPILGGFLADLLFIWLRPGVSGWRFQAFAFLAPAALLVAYFVVLWATGPDRLVGSSHRGDRRAGRRRRLGAQPAARRRGPAIGRSRPDNSATAVTWRFIRVPPAEGRRPAPRGRARGALERDPRHGQSHRRPRLRLPVARRAPPVPLAGSRASRPVGSVGDARRAGRGHDQGRARAARCLHRIPQSGRPRQAGGHHRRDLRRPAHPGAGGGLERNGVPGLRDPVRPPDRPVRGGVHDHPQPPARRRRRFRGDLLQRP